MLVAPPPHGPATDSQVGGNLASTVQYLWIGCRLGFPHGGIQVACTPAPSLMVSLRLEGTLSPHPPFLSGGTGRLRSGCGRGDRGPCRCCPRSGAAGSPATA